MPATTRLKQQGHKNNLEQTQDISETPSLRFGDGNKKLAQNKHRVWIFDLPAGHSCPGAAKCQAFANKSNGKILDGTKQEFRCYAASLESAFTNVREKRWANYNALLEAGTAERMAALILRDMPAHAAWVRIHSSGDFFSQAYFDAWVTVAKERPNAVFYAYTKSLPFVKRRLGEIPENLRLLASEGGRYDRMIDELGLPRVVVVAHPDVAEAMGLEVDHDDSHAIEASKSFALLLHGAQAPGSQASRDIKKMKDEGVKYSYS